MSKCDTDEMRILTAEQISELINRELGRSSFVIDLNLNTADEANYSAKSFLKNFSEKYKEYGHDDNERGKYKTTYKYVFVTVLDDGVVAVVGKTTFHRNFKDEAYNNYAKSGKGGLGDLFKPYKNELTAQLIKQHFKNVGCNAETLSVEKKIKQAVIVPVKITGLGEASADKETKCWEKNIGNLLIGKKICILNRDSHLH